MQWPAPLLVSSPPSTGDALVDLAVASAAVANYCDHVEHCEDASRDWVIVAGETLRTVAIRLATDASLDVFDHYAERLESIERRHPLFPVQNFCAHPAAREASTWHELQGVQLRHDQLYHPDVLGLHKLDQLRHYALHIAKLTGAVAAATRDEQAAADFYQRRLPDLLVFGLKLATVMGQRLPDERLPRPV